MSEKILGLDIGISSLGWAAINYDKENPLNNQIIKSGVRIFTIAENPKTGESLALPRRLARGARRTNKRKKERVKAIKKLFIQYLNLTKDDLFGKDNIFNQKNRKDVWQLRDKALKRELNSVEFARVLTHIAKRRGYKSNRKVDEKENSDGKKVLGAIKKNQELLKKYLTIGQAIYQTSKLSKIRRNKKDEYLHSVSREMLEEEIKTIFEKQREFGNVLASKKFEEEYIKLFLKQRDFASVDKMVGYCTLEGKKEKRAPKTALSSEEFVTLTKLINTKIIDKNENERNFTKEELGKALDLCKHSEQPTYLKLKEFIGLDESDYFKGVVFYEIDKTTGEITNKVMKFVSGFKGYHQLRKEVEKVLSKTHWQNLSQDRKLLNEIAKIFSYHKSDEKINNELQKLEFKSLNKEEKQILIKALIENINFDKFLNLSLKAIDKLLVYMKEGKRYDEALDLCKYKKQNGKKEKFLRALNKDEQLELTNPVIKRALAQSRKIINALIRKYGQFDKIHIELTREIKKSHSERNKIQKGQEEYKKIKENLVTKFVENFGREPRGNELLKYRLWEEQDGKCIYSGKTIKIEDLVNDFRYAEIDHILPFSRSLEDGMHNKVLVLAKENQDKKDRTPYEHFTQINRDWEWFEGFVNSLKNIKKPKRIRLLKKNFNEDSEKEFRERNANDTAYMARFIKNFIEENLELKSNEKLKVFTRSGTLTSMLRHSWGIGEKSRKNHLHHAVDAIILAFSTQSEVQRLSTLSAKTEKFIYEKSQEKAKKIIFEPPMQNFREEVQASIDDIFVSFAPRRSISGAAHKETIYKKDSGKGVFEVNGGMAELGEVKRVDVFKKEDKYHFVYLYPADFEKYDLPNTSIKNIQIDESFDFIFSMFKDEFIEIKQKEKDAIAGYFKFAEGDGRFHILPHTQTQLDKKKNRFSTGKLEYIKKYQVCPLGNRSEVKSEKRVGTKRMR